jgi:glycosyltransferase involved in cell wall biosynthesis
MDIKFSLVTTCRNEIQSFARWQQNVLEQTRQPDEIVVVDAFSDDGTAEALFAWSKADSRIKVIQAKGAAAFGRNLAIKNASHEYILSTDMGVRLSSNWCEELIRPFEGDKSTQVVIGNTCIDVETVKSVATRAEYYLENGGFADPGPGSVAGNRSVAYLKRVWLELGGLPEDLTFYADDSVFGLQIIAGGFKTAYAPAAMTYWGRPQKLKQFWREQFVYGRGDGEALIKISYAFQLHLKGMPFVFVPLLNGLRIMQKQFKFSAIKKALNKLDLLALCVMPVLAFGNGWNLGKGYMIGYKRGNEHCLECRKRLNREFNNC